MHTITIGQGKTINFKTEADVVLFLACTLDFHNFSTVYRRAKGSGPTIRIYRENTTSEARARFLTLAADTQLSDGTMLIDNLPGGRSILNQVTS